MLGRTHMVAGAVPGALIGLHSGPLGMAAGAVLGGASALVPDIDQPGTPAAKVPVLGWALSHALHHRGVTHSLLAMVAWWLAVRWVDASLHGPVWLGLAALAGYGSHLLLDAATVSGVPLFWPASRKYTLRLCKTGSSLEHLVVFPLCCLALAAVAWRWG